MKNLITYLMLFGSIVFGLTLNAQGSTCATATVAVLGTNISDGPSSGGGAVSDCGAGNIGNNADWFKYTASSNSYLKAASCNGGIDTRVSVFEGSCNSLNCVGSSDDDCQLQAGGSNWASTVSFFVTAGTTYYFQWDDRWSISGFQWILSEITPDCPDLILNIGDPCNFGGGGSGIVSESCDCIQLGVPDCPTLISPAAGNPEVQYDATSSITLSWSLNGVQQVEGTKIYGGTAPNEISLLGSVSSTSTQATITGVNPGVFYWSLAPFNSFGEAMGCEIRSFTVVVNCPELGLNFGDACNDGNPSTLNDVVLEDECICAGTPIPANALCTSATQITEGTYYDNKISGGGGATEICFDSGLSSNAIWFSFIAPSDGEATVSSSIDLNTPDTRVSIYSGNCSALVCEAQDDDGGAGYTSLVTFPVTNGTEYIIEWDDRWGNAEFDFELSFDGTPSCQVDDKAILEQVWLALNSPNLAGWNFSPVVELNNTWEGITMTADGCNIMKIDLANKGLTGTLAPELGELSQLIDLKFQFNELTGTIPASLGNLSQLNDLRVHGNNLVGVIPPELGDLTQLDYILLSQNELVGNIPSELSNLTQLIWLYLDNNKLTGTIPAEIGTLSQLTLISVDNNQLTGTIPPEIGNLSLLENLNLHNNQLIGILPPELGNLSLLSTFRVFNNQVTGCIPLSYQSFCSTGNFDISSNPFLDNDDLATFCSSGVGVCKSSCATDFDGNGVTDGTDFTIFLGNFGLPCDGPICPVDVNSDGVIDGTDFTIFLGNFGLVCGN